jgi:hypothetical protein
MGKPLIESGVVNRIPAGRAETRDEIAQAVIFLVAVVTWPARQSR